MNTKVILAVFCAIQLAAGASIADVPIIQETLDKLESLLQSIGDSAQKLADGAEADLEQLGKNVVAEIQSEFSKIQDLPATAEACLKQAEDDVQGIIDSEKSKLTPLVLREGIKILPVVGKVNATIQKIKTIASATEAAFKDCADKGVIEQVACDAKVVADITQEVQEVVPEVNDEATLVEKTVEEVVADVTPTIQDILKDATSQLEGLVPKALQCIA